VLAHKKKKRLVGWCCCFSTATVAFYVCLWYVSNLPVSTVAVRKVYLALQEQHVRHLMTLYSFGTCYATSLNVPKDTKTKECATSDDRSDFVDAIADPWRRGVFPVPRASFWREKWDTLLRGDPWQRHKSLEMSRPGQPPWIRQSLRNAVFCYRAILTPRIRRWRILMPRRIRQWNLERGEGVVGVCK
jgi:hypothetical protein